MPSYRIYSSNSAQNSACSYYRLYLPMSTMEKMGLPVEMIFDDGSGGTERQRTAAFLESDISLVYQNIGERAIKLMQDASTLEALPNENGDMRYPPSFVSDTDDDLFNVHPLNVSYRNLGIRDPSGRPCNDGDEIGIAHPHELATEAIARKLAKTAPNATPGTTADYKSDRYVMDDDSKWHLYVPLWKDGENIDFKKNRQALENYVATINLSQLVTCSTPKAAEYISREIGSHINTFVTPNAVDFAEYPEIELTAHPNEVRICWEGAATHHEGLWPLSDAMGRLAAKYPHTTWYFFGAPYRWAGKNLPADRVRFIPWTAYDAYKLRIGTINHDIAIAPLARHQFNNSRSAIRWYENSAIWKPAATVAQRWGAFADEIEEGKTGLLFDDAAEFEQKMSLAIEDASLRLSMAANAKDWVRTNRDPKKIALALFNKYVEVREGHKQSIPIKDHVTHELIKI